jgi:predicted kinase
MAVIILQDMPGIGKSTLIRGRYKRAKVVSADRFFMKGDRYIFEPTKLGEAHAQCLRGFTALVSDEENKYETIVVDNTNTTVAEYAPCAALAQAYGHELKIITVLGDPLKAHKRNKHGVPPKDVLNMDHQLRSGLPHVPPRWPHEVVLESDLNPRRGRGIPKRSVKLAPRKPRKTNW